MHDLLRSGGRRAAAILMLAVVALTTSPPAAAAEADDGLYRALGERPGITALVDDFVARLGADARLQTFFRDTDLTHLRAQLRDQICEVAGGPCHYDGPPMKQAHEGIDVRQRDFLALVEVLQDAMAARGVAFGVQNRLLARLAPMHRDIVNTP